MQRACPFPSSHIACTAHLYATLNTILIEFQFVKPLSRWLQQSAGITRFCVVISDDFRFMFHLIYHVCIFGFAGGTAAAADISKRH